MKARGVCEKIRKANFSKTELTTILVTKELFLLVVKEPRESDERKRTRIVAPAIGSKDGLLLYW